LGAVEPFALKFIYQLKKPRYDFSAGLVNICIHYRLRFCAQILGFDGLLAKPPHTLDAKMGPGLHKILAAISTGILIRISMRCCGRVRIFRATEIESAFGAD
jgi:hypothetical protein